MGKKEKRDRSRSKDRKRKRKKKRSRSSSSSSSRDSSKERHAKVHKKKHHKKEKKKNKDHLPSIDDIIAQRLQEKRQNEGQSDNNSPDQNLKARAPMTKAEYDEKQSVVRRVYDEDTGRTRLVKGTRQSLNYLVEETYD